MTLTPEEAFVEEQVYRIIPHVNYINTCSSGECFCTIATIAHRAEIKSELRAAIEYGKDIGFQLGIDKKFQDDQAQKAYERGLAAGKEAGKKEMLARHMSISTSVEDQYGRPNNQS